MSASDDKSKQVSGEKPAWVTESIAHSDGIELSDAELIETAEFELPDSLTGSASAQSGPLEQPEEAAFHAPENTGAQAALASLDRPVEVKRPEDEPPIVPTLGVIAPDEQTSGKKKRRKRKVSHIILNTLAVIVALCIVAAAGFGAWLYFDDAAQLELVPAKTVLDGKVNISGLTRDEVEEIVQKRADLGYSTEVDLQVTGKVYEIELTDVGEINVAATVNKAFEPYDGTTFYSRAEKRVKELLGEPQPEEEHSIITVCDVAKSKLKKRIKEIAGEVDQTVVDAGYRYKDGGLVATKSRKGIELDQEKTVDAVQEKLVGSTGTVSVDAIVEVTQPQKAQPGQAIYVGTKKCRLIFYENGEVVWKWKCSPGRKGYETPKGDWYLEYKDPNPVWENPHSDWSKDMPETIEPGKDNPLGLRALAVSCGDGIFIHGTTNTAALGTRDSHGCVRLSNKNIVKLYDRVAEGIPIIIR